MATLAQIRAKVDTFLADLWTNTIVPKEEAYFALHGRYAQVLVSPTVIPADDATGTFVKRPPSDENFAADFTFTIVSPIPAQMEIHTHDRGTEHGFTAHVWVEVLGKIYHRAKFFLRQDLSWKGNWVSGAFNQNDRVSHLGRFWIANKNTNQEPVNLNVDSKIISDWDAYIGRIELSDTAWHEVIKLT